MGKSSLKGALKACLQASVAGTECCGRIPLRQTFALSLCACILVSCMVMINGCGCGREEREINGKRLSDGQPTKGSWSNSGQSTPKNEKLAHSAFPWLESGQEASGKKVSGDNRLSIRKPGEEFNRKYTQGLEFMEKEEYPKAVEVFEEIIKTLPGSDEASMAEYRMAQIHFRNKSNSMAMEVYKRIIQNYPNSPISENARAAVTYLETFEKHEKSYVSPDTDDRKRRGF